MSCSRPRMTKVDIGSPQSTSSNRQSTRSTRASNTAQTTNRHRRPDHPDPRCLRHHGRLLFRGSNDGLARMKRAVAFASPGKRPPSAMPSPRAHAPSYPFRIALTACLEELEARVAALSTIRKPGLPSAPSTSRSRQTQRTVHRQESPSWLPHCTATYFALRRLSLVKVSVGQILIPTNSPFSSDESGRWLSGKWL